MEITKAQMVDLRAILDLQRLCYHENAVRYDDFNILPLTQSIDDLEKEYATCTILKATDQDKIVGSIRAFEKEGTCFIGRVIVHPEFQNKGIGMQLMEEAELAFKYVDRYELFTGYRDDKNLYFYKKLGYHPFKQVKISDQLTIIFLDKTN